MAQVVAQVVVARVVVAQVVVAQAVAQDPSPGAVALVEVAEGGNVFHVMNHPAVPDNMLLHEQLRIVFRPVASSGKTELTRITSNRVVSNNLFFMMLCLCIFPN